MELKEHKLEIGIAILCVLLLTGLFRVFGSFFTGPRIEVGNISYEMPRPKSDIVGEFGLGDREIDRRYKNPFEKQAQAQERKPLAANVKPAVAPAQAKRKAAGQWMAIRQPDHNVRVIDRANRSGLDSDSAQSGHDYAPQRNAERQSGEEGGSPADKKKQVTKAEWIALMASQPTPENMQKLAAAYKAGDVDSGTFYEIINGMLDKQNQEQQLLAIYGLGLVPEAAGFSTVALKISSFPENSEVKTRANAYLYSFSSPTRNGHLIAALKSSESVVKLLAADVILTGLNSGGVETPRGGGRGENAAASNSSYQQFIPIFQEMSVNGDGDAKSIAQQILQLLQRPTA